MRKKIQALEQKAMPLEPSEEERTHLLHAVHSYTQHFINTLPTSPAFTSCDHALDHLFSSHRFSTTPTATIHEIINTLTATIEKPGLNPASPGYIAYIPGGGLYASALADFLIAILNKHPSKANISPGAIHIHNTLLSWFIELVGFPKDAWGDLTSGGSIATLTAFISARETHQLTPSTFHKTVVYTTEYNHHCIDQALSICLSNTYIKRIIKTNKALEMDCNALRSQIKKDQSQGLTPWLLIGNAGTTDTGAIDPLETMATIAKEENLWFHVDAAYGGFFLLVPECKALFTGIEQADSLVLDPHKGLFLPYGLGVVLIRSEQHLKKALHQEEGAYMQDAEINQNDTIRSPSDYSLELSRPWRALRLWLPFKQLGTQVFADALLEKRLLAQYTADALSHLPNIALISQPTLSIVCFRYQPHDENEADAYNKGLLSYLNNNTHFHLSSTQIKEKFFIRIAILCFRTHLDGIDQLIDHITAWHTQHHTS